MPLTRPSFNNLNTNLAAFSDSLTITNFGNVANRDLGEVFDRSQSGGSNVAIIWRESIQGFNLIYTSGTGKETGNLTVTGNANLTIGNLIVAGTNIFWANGSVYGGSGGSPGGSNTQIQYNSSGAFAGATSFLYQANGQVIANAGISSTSTTTGTMVVTGGIGASGNIYADQFFSLNNGNGTNYRVGDDISLGDINLANTLGLRGLQDPSQAYIVFGNTNQLSLGRSGAGALTYQGAFTAQGGITNTPIGNATASSATFTTLVATSTSSLNGTVSTNNILPFGNANANIGSTSLQFNTIFAKATSAQYADLAEKYIADAEYTPGIVVIFGGDAEITISTESHDTRVAGIISTDPAYLMNSGAVGLAVALTGRVPCLVKGPVYKGDVLVTSVIPGTAQKIDNSMYKPGSILGKALQNNLTDEVHLIEVAVGRF